MNRVRIVIPELFLPPELMQLAAAELQLPSLQQLLARAERQQASADTLEQYLGQVLGVADGGLAPYCLAGEGGTPSALYCLRADPVHLGLHGDSVQVHASVRIDAMEAAGLCASLNQYFAAAGMTFLAPHPQRWYLQLPQAPQLTLRPLSSAGGSGAWSHLPSGADALHWHGVMNEIQMLLFDHPVNQQREARGELAINSLWLWAGGTALQPLQQSFDCVLSDDELALLLARAAGMSAQFLVAERGLPMAHICGEVLLVWQGLQCAVLAGDLAAWRDSVLRFEQQCMAPLLTMLKAGKLDCIELEVPGAAMGHFVLTRAATWKLWRSARPLAYYVRHEH